MRALNSITAFRITIGITIYLVAVTVIVFFLSERNVNIPDGFELAVLAVNYSFFLGMPVRWGLMLLLILRSVRTRPLKLLPAVAGLQVVVATAIHMLLGLLSLIGWLTVWTFTTTSDRVLGLILHAVLPPLAVAWVYRRSRQPVRQSPAPS